MVPRKRRAGEFTAFMAEHQKVKVIPAKVNSHGKKRDNASANNNNNNNDNDGVGGKRRCNCKKVDHGNLPVPVVKAVPKLKDLIKEETPIIEDVKVKLDQDEKVPIFRSPPLDPAAVEYVRKLPPSPLAPAHYATALGPVKDQPRMTLVLDVDETLVHCTGTSKPDLKADESFQVGNMCVNIRKRPYLQEFLDFAASHFEVVAFTAGLERVSSHVLHRLDKSGSRLHHRLYRDACYLPGGGKCLKPLNCLGRDLNKTVIVDNTLECMGFDVGNAILIKTWRGDDDDDNELFKLKLLLKDMKDNVENEGGSVQKFLDEKLGLKKMVFG